ncbi:hypothetical protein D1013_12865 [Euzebyella marina]|uniref:Uncharacterized protein n=1 Tax=Euzebyella marina TaxID=1761453 RepID=A0A3G2L7S3_9FLAO|nr:hypothetical protein [Euzebyella marina]AYN68201.1 hypothetical protein D1013_12865 [Euzebyella marina]MBG48395.1 hypothetical protein [Pseudozobellia sp.]|tara:strand:+ start:737841 stop:738404 length:564 start_codon:yes stop_codon:yes gene_type:complete
MPKKEKILKVPLRISMTVILLGMLLKILEWPYAIPIVLFGFANTGILYFFRFWNKSDRKFLDIVKLVLVLSWTTNGILRILDFQHTLFLQIIVGISFMTWFIMEGTAYFLDEDRKAKNQKIQVMWNFAMVVGALAIIAGSLLNVMNWKFAIPLLVLGITIIAAYILKDLFSAGKIENKDRNNEEYQL